MADNPTLHLPAVETVDAEVVHEQAPSGLHALAKLTATDISQLNTSQGLAVMSLGQRLAYAEQLIKSGLVPKHFNTPEKALLAFEQGEVLGMRPIEALSRLYVIDGKVSMYAELMRARAAAAGLRFQLLEEKVDVLSPEFDQQGQPTGRDIVTDWRWTYEMLEILPDKTVMRYKMSKTWTWAQKAGLTGKDPWKKYPDNMMANRITADLIRRYRPDVLMGFYEFSELADASNTTAYVLDDDMNPVPVL